MQYCKLGINGKILNIIEVAETDCQDADGNFDNTIGLQFLENLLGWALWTPVLSDSVGTPTIGGYWIDEHNVFKTTQPFTSWTFNNSTGEWEAPSANPDPDNVDNPYIWSGENQTWFQK
jgi:hypothetical protein